MTVIAWDGNTLAADRMCNSNGLATEMEKLKTLSDGRLVAVWGTAVYFHSLIEWLEAGALPLNFPRMPDEGWAGLVEVKPDRVNYYENNPHPLTVTGEFMAWGYGREFAIGAMAAGADAVAAVNIASRHCVYCGNGINWAKRG